MSVNVVNTNPRDGGTLQTTTTAGVDLAQGTFDKSATITATLTSGSTTWNANENGNKFVLQPPQTTVQWAVTFGTTSTPVPGGLTHCTLTVTGTATDGSGSGTSTITVSTPRSGMPRGNSQQARRNGQAKKAAAQQSQRL